MKRTRDTEALLKKQLMNPDRADVERRLAATPDDAALYYELGMSLFRADDYAAAEDAFSHGLVLEPFDPWLYFGRGRARSKQLKYWESLADFELCCRLDSDNRAFRYYLATTESLAGQFEEAANDFRICVDLAEPNDVYPLITWLYLTYLLDLNDKASANEALSLADDNVQPRQMDYGYHRCVQLFKGNVTPENFVDIPDMEEKCLKKPGRIQLELYMMYYGLYAYSVMIDDAALGRSAIEKIVSFPPSPAFGYQKGMEVAKRMGLV